MSQIDELMKISSMQFGLFLIIFTLGTLLCANCAAPTSSVIKYSDTGKKLLLKLLNQVLKYPQNNEGESETGWAPQIWNQVKKGVQLAIV